MIKIVPLTIEKPADDDGMILEEITKKDIVLRLADRGIGVDEEDIEFVEEHPIELGLWRIKLRGLREEIKYWVVPSTHD